MDLAHPLPDATVADLHDAIIGEPLPEATKQQIEGRLPIADLVYRHAWRVRDLRRVTTSDVTSPT